MFNKCKFKQTPAYMQIKRFLHTNSMTNIKNNPVVDVLIKNIYEKILSTPLSTEKSRYANKNCQLIFKYLNELVLEDFEIKGKKIFEISNESKYTDYTNEESHNEEKEELYDDEVNFNINLIPEMNISLEGLKIQATQFFENKNYAHYSEFKTIKITKEDLLILKNYLINSYGNSQRADYGTGHELNFLCFLFCLNKFIPVDITKSMETYYFSSRVFIIKFKLEAAGSKGVWGVDDYEIISFYLTGIRCSKNNNKKMADCFNIPFVRNLVQFVCTYKRSTNLNDNSPFLFDILNERGTEIIERVEERIERELWGSFVVMQHFIHSSFLKEV